MPTNRQDIIIVNYNIHGVPPRNAIITMIHILHRHWWVSKIQPMKEMNFDTRIVEMAGRTNVIYGC